MLAVREFFDTLVKKASMMVVSTVLQIHQATGIPVQQDSDQLKLHCTKAIRKAGKIELSEWEDMHY